MGAFSILFWITEVLVGWPKISLNPFTSFASDMQLASTCLMAIAYGVLAFKREDKRSDVSSYGLILLLRGKY
jgi:hypothetical protein